MARPPRDSLRWRLFAATSVTVGGAALRALSRTWRIEVLGRDPFVHGDRVILAAWHHGLFAAAGGWRDRGMVVPVSHSRDGDLIDRVLQRLGFAESARGSSSKGAMTLLRSLIRRARAGETIGMLPDGPRGPAGVAKPGVIALARTAGLPLVPVGVAARPSVRFGSWDRAVLPLPFARVVCRYGPPLEVPKRANADQIEAARVRLEEELHRLDAEVAAILGVEPGAPTQG